MGIRKILQIHGLLPKCVFQRRLKPLRCQTEKGACKVSAFANIQQKREVMFQPMQVCFYLGLIFLQMKHAQRFQTHIFGNALYGLCLKFFLQRFAVFAAAGINCPLTIRQERGRIKSKSA